MNSSSVNSSGLPWELKAAAGVLWVVIGACCAVILRSGLDALHIPGLDALPFLLWPLAVALTVADSVLVLAYLRMRSWPILLAVALLFALTLGLEAVNVSGGIARLASEPGIAQATADRSERLRVEAADRRAEAEARFFRVAATREQWTKDGDASNDGQEVECVAALEAAKAAQHQAEAMARADAENAIRADLTKHPLVGLEDFTGWIVAGIAVLKVLALALASLVHSAPVRAGNPSEVSSISPLSGPVSLPPVIFSREKATRPPNGRARRTIVGASLGHLADRFMR